MIIKINPTNKFLRMVGIHTILSVTSEQTTCRYAAILFFRLLNACIHLL